MQVEISRQVSKWMALDRWENEGGRTCLPLPITPDEDVDRGDAYMVYNADTTKSVSEGKPTRVRPKWHG